MNYPGQTESAFAAGFANKFKPDSKLLAGATAELQSYVRMNIIDGDTRELDRITKYFLYWKFYEGYHYRDLNESMLSFNYVRAFIDKIGMFLLGKDAFTFQVKNLMTEQVEEDFEKRVERALQYHWNKSRKSLIAYEILQMGSVTGDVWVGVEWQEVGKYVKIKCFDSRQCFPMFKNGDYNTLESFVLRISLDSASSEKKYKLFCYQYTETKITTWYQKDTSSGSSAKRYEEKTVENSYGFIPVVHIKNRPFSPGYFSKSDASDILKINKVYNEMMQQEKSIIDYHVTPTTVITGGTAKNLQRGLGKIWSGLPAEANVFNLGMDVDMSGLNEYLKTIKTAMHELSDVPENSLGKIQAISNTSAAALHITYQPLVQQADLKAITYGYGFTELNTMILAVHEKHEPANKMLTEIKKVDKDYITNLRVEPVFTYGLPLDRQNELNMGISEISAGIGSRKEIMERLGKHNVPELLEEIQKEKDDDMERNIMEQNLMNSMSGDAGGDSSESQPAPVKQNNESVNGKFAVVKNSK